MTITLLHNGKQYPQGTGVIQSDKVVITCKKNVYAIPLAWMLDWEKKGVIVCNPPLKNINLTLF